MKKVSILFIVLFAIMNSIYAQVTFNPGIHAGLNVSKFNGIDLQTKTDFYLGVFGGVKFGKIYTFQPEITYTRQGSKGFSNPQYEIGVKPDVSYHYLSVLINNKFYLNKNLFLMLGEFSDITIKKDIYVEGNVKRNQDYDIGLFGGVGCAFNKNILIEARFKKGFVGALDYQGENITNQVIQLGLAYTFAKK